MITTVDIEYIQELDFYGLSRFTQDWREQVSVLAHRPLIRPLRFGIPVPIRETIAFRTTFAVSTSCDTKIQIQR